MRMQWFNRRRADADNVLDLCDELTSAFAVGEYEAETLPITLAPPTILDRSSAVVASFLSDARAERVRLETDIRDLQEKLRQTNLAIKAFEPTLVILDEGYSPADDARKSYDVAIASKRKCASKASPALQAAE